MSSSTPLDHSCESQVSIEIKEASADNDKHQTESNDDHEAYHPHEYIIKMLLMMMMRLKKVVVEALKDGSILLLMCCASLSMLIDVKRNGPKSLFLDGIIIVLSISFVATFGSIFRFLKTRFSMGSSSPLVTRDDISGNHHHHRKEANFENGIHKTSSFLEKIWLSLSLVILIVQVIRCFLCKCDDESLNLDPKGVKNTVEEIMNEAANIAYKKGEKSTSGLVRVLCVVVFATRDGLPLGLFVLLLVSSRKIKSSFEETLMVQKLSACAMLGLVTTLFVSKTDDLTLNHANMGELWVGLNLIHNVLEELSCQVLEKLQIGVCCMNSSGSESMEEDSLLLWAHKVLQVDNHNDDIGKNCVIIQNESVEIHRGIKFMVKKTIDDAKEAVEMHWRGDLECVLSKCSHYYDPDGTIQSLDEETRAKFKSIIDEDNTRSNLKQFGFAYKKVETEEKSASTKLEEEEEESDGHSRTDVADEKTHAIRLKVDDHDHGWILIGLVFLKNPYPPEVKEAIQAFKDLDVNIKMVDDDDDDEKTARIMAFSSGIFSPNEVTSESAVTNGSKFRGIPEETLMKIIKEAHVIVNTTPADKLIMVQCLKKKGDEEVVAILTDSCIREIPSLIEADVGIFMCNDENNIPESAKEDADIIIGRPKMNMAEIVGIFRFGRYVCQSIANLLELHVILNFCAVMLNLIFEVWKSKAIFSSLQLLWTNMVVETLGAFALGIILEIKPSSNHQHHDVVLPVITKKMWRNVAIHTGAQVSFLLMIELKGKSIGHDVDDGVVTSMIFNSFILCQVFILVGVTMKMNGKYGISWRAPPLFSMEKLVFLIVVGMILALQVVMTDIMGVVDHWGNMDLKRWFICIGVAGLSTLVGSVANWMASTIASVIV
ncbi:OLC1v1022540C1 [Oldenlandia corymbosa var. corymbosa]|uniref:OLC1v1022540C1 n=1 Tax=Oldenlandia corymbosa var. corymbosa TaxID=529605 RepID=A0AAV1BY14_OLDCO|nr:OLC1v1022540C1 [Oldenlandia corymbosa var. corymbosa]